MKDYEKPTLTITAFSMAQDVLGASQITKWDEDWTPNQGPWGFDL